MMSSPRLAIADPIFPRLYSPDETLYSDLEGVSPSMNLHLFPEGLGPLAIRIEIPEHNQSKTLVVVPGLTCADIVQKIGVSVGVGVGVGAMGREKSILFRD